MIELAISARDRRLLAFGTSVVGSLLTLARGIPALRQWEARQLAEAASVAGQLASTRAALRRLPRVRDSLAARTRRLDAVDSTLLSAASPAAAAAGLTSIVEQIADDSDLKVASMEIRADSVPTGSLAHVSVRVNGVCDVAGLAAFLRAVEAGETLLVVRDILVSQSEPTAPEGKPEALRVEALIEGVAIIRPPKT